MAGFYFNGKVYQVPQALSKINVILNTGAPLPDFGVGLIIGRNYKGPGQGSDVSDPVAGFTKSSNAAAFYGQDSDLAVAFKNWSLHGGGTVFTLGTSATKQSIKTILGGMKLISKEYGAHTANIEIKTELGGKVTFTPPKNVFFLEETAKTNSVLVRTSGTLKVEDTVFVATDTTDGTSNTNLVASSNADNSFTIRKIENEGKLVRITFKEDMVVTNVTVAKEARIFQLDADKAEIHDIAVGDGSTYADDLEDAINGDSAIFTAEATGTVTATTDKAFVYVDSPATGMQNGISPVTQDWDGENGIIASLPEYVKDNNIRLINPIVTEGQSLYKAGTHATIETTITSDLKGFAVSQRTNKQPVQLFVGGLLGLTTPSAIESFLSALNSQDIICAVGGFDGVAPAASFATAAMACVSAATPAHNLTRDKIAAVELEIKWTLPDTDVDKLIDKGGLLIISKKAGHVIAKGVNTLQANTSSWNLDSTTYLPMQRAMADFVDIALREGVDNTFIGEDGVSGGMIGDYVTRTLENISKLSPTIIREFALDGVEPSQNQGYLVDYSVKFAEETNFVGLSMDLIVS